LEGPIFVFWYIRVSRFNPERIMAKNTHIELHVDEALCKGVDGCGLCMHICPKKVYDRSARLTAKGIRPPEPARPDDCTGCMLCMIYCPDLAIVVEKTKEQ
jgi:2-oxoglutarate ferredoxin oxidoreductase subunit delta